MDVKIEKTNGRAVINLDGRFDIKSNVTFRNATKPLLEDAGLDAIVVDFARVPFVDSSALGLLLLLRAQAQEAKKDVFLTHCGADLQKVLSIAQFHRMFSIE